MHRTANRNTARAFFPLLGHYAAVVLLLCSPSAVADGTDSGELFSSPTLNFYSSIMLDTGYQKYTNNPDWFDVVRPTQLPAFDGEFEPDGRYFSGVRQSRIGFKGATQTHCGEVKTHFEYEMFGVGNDAGQTTFRLRHAWGEFCQLGAGQTWSVFMDPDIFPNSIEYWGPSGMVFFRNVQLRWTPWSDGDSRFAIALERPGASRAQTPYDERIELQNVRGQFKFPDLSMHFRSAGDWGHGQIAAIVRRIAWVDTLDDEFDLSDHEIGWGINLTTNVKFEQATLKVGAVFGEGIENYMNDAPADIGVVNNFDDPDKPLLGEALPMFGLSAFLDVNWNKQWTSTVGYSVIDIDTTNGQLPSAFERGEYALANVLYHPNDKLFLGPELQYAERHNRSDGFQSHDFRLQFSVKYSFDIILKGE